MILPLEALQEGGYFRGFEDWSQNFRFLDSNCGFSWTCLIFSCCCSMKELSFLLISLLISSWMMSRIESSCSICPMSVPHCRLACSSFLLALSKASSNVFGFSNEMTRGFDWSMRSFLRSVSIFLHLGILGLTLLRCKVQWLQRHKILQLHWDSEFTFGDLERVEFPFQSFEMIDERNCCFIAAKLCFMLIDIQRIDANSLQNLEDRIQIE